MLPEHKKGANSNSVGKQLKINNYHNQGYCDFDHRPSHSKTDCYLEYMPTNANDPVKGKVCDHSGLYIYVQ